VAKKADLCQQLRAEAKRSGWTVYKIAKTAGVRHDIVSMFLSGERDIRSGAFAKIAAALGLELRPRE
jgi:transcriptional regulator with XRE-family HTH domain